MRLAAAIGVIAITALAVGIVWVATKPTHDEGARTQIASLRAEVTQLQRQAKAARQASTWIAVLCKGMESAKTNLKGYEFGNVGAQLSKYLLSVCAYAGVAPK